MTAPAWTSPRGHAPALDFAALAAMVENCAFHKWLGVQLKTLDDTGVAIAMPWRAEFDDRGARQKRPRHRGAMIVDVHVDCRHAAPESGRDCIVGRKVDQ